MKVALSELRIDLFQESKRVSDLKIGFGIMKIYLNLNLLLMKKTKKLKACNFKKNFVVGGYGIKRNVDNFWANSSSVTVGDVVQLEEVSI